MLWSPASEMTDDFFNEVSGMRIAEAQKKNAEMIAVSCTGCIALARLSRERDNETYHIIELAQMTLGEKPAHRTIELRKKFNECFYNNTNVSNIFLYFLVWYRYHLLHGYFK